MQFILIHRPRGVFPLEISKASIELAKKLEAKPEALVPEGKLLSSYSSRSGMAIFCVWDVLKAENLMPLCEQMAVSGWDTEFIPAEKVSVAIPKWEKALAEASRR